MGHRPGISYAERLARSKNKVYKQPMATKHLVVFNVRAGVELNNGNVQYTSKCGRYIITKSMTNNGGRNGYFTTPSYKLDTVIPVAGFPKTCDSMAEARMYANFEVDPNWSAE